MDKVIVYTRADGGVCVVMPTGEVPLEMVLSKDVPTDAISPRVVETADMPQDYDFRNAWTQDGDMVSVDMPKARAIHMDKIREARAPTLAELDREWMKFTGQKNQKEADAIEEKRQKLRALPQTVDLESAKTPEEL